MTNSSQCRNQATVDPDTQHKINIVVSFTYMDIIQRQPQKKVALIQCRNHKAHCIYANYESCELQGSLLFELIMSLYNSSFPFRIWWSMNRIICMTHSTACTWAHHINCKKTESLCMDLEIIKYSYPLFDITKQHMHIPNSFFQNWAR